MCVWCVCCVCVHVYCTSIKKREVGEGERGGRRVLATPITFFHSKPQHSPGLTPPKWTPSKDSIQTFPFVFFSLLNREVGAEHHYSPSLEHHDAFGHHLNPGRYLDAVPLAVPLWEAVLRVPLDYMSPAVLEHHHFLSFF
eukprot:Sspe_Gene.49375::Locus_26565_Transcript_1_1_Confidence_1.000_Length_537::g.49375::m.49375